MYGRARGYGEWQMTRLRRRSRPELHSFATGIRQDLDAVTAWPGEQELTSWLDRVEADDQLSSVWTNRLGGNFG
jgi:hypothetical protein